MKNKIIISIILIVTIILNILFPVVAYATSNTLNKNSTENTSNDEKNVVETNSVNEVNQTSLNNVSENTQKTNNINENITDNTTINKVNETTKNTLIEDNSVKTINTNSSLKQELSGTQTIADGIYKIRAAKDNNKLINVANGDTNNGANIELKQSTNATQNKFYITYLGYGYYKIESCKSNKILDVAGAGTTNGTNVQQYENNGTVAQQWIIKDAGNGYYSIISKCNGLYVDLPGASTQDGTNIQMYEGNGTIAQQFKFEKIEQEQGTQTIEDGTYKIKSAIDNSKLINVANGATNNGANIELNQNGNATQNKFNITYLGNGYYKIANCKSNKVLDVAGAGILNGTNVQQYESNGTAAQQWIIKDVGNNNYSIISKCNGLYIDLPGASTQNGTNIQMYEGNGTIAQQFKFEKIEQEQGTQTIADGMYKIKSAINNSKVLSVSGANKDNGTRIILSSDTDAKNQKFHIKYLGDGYYSIRAVHSKSSLDVAGAGIENGTVLQQYSYNATAAQQWIIKDVGSGYYSLISKCNGLYIDLPGVSTNDGTKLQMYEGNGTAAQQFSFESTTATALDDGIYEIGTKLKNGMVLDISGGSREDSANVQLWEKANVNQQKFKITYLEDNYYKIESAKSKKVLDVAGGGTTSGTNVQQYTYNGTDAQKWYIKDLGDGTYNIISKSSGLCLDVTGGGTSNGTNVQIYETNGTLSQLFKFTETALTEYNGIDVSQFNGTIDWINLKNSAANVDYAIIRAGYRGYGTGRLVTDSTFLRNVMQTKANNIDIGLYFFTQAVNEAEAVEEANYVLNLIRTYNISVKYPIVIDTEYSSSQTNGQDDYQGRADNLSKEERTAVCRAFCQTIQNNGYTPMIYANRDWLYNNLNIQELSYDVWLAHYTTNTDYKYDYVMWQYSSSGSVAGINGSVDLDICYKKY